MVGFYTFTIIFLVEAILSDLVIFYGKPGLLIKIAGYIVPIALGSTYFPVYKMTHKRTWKRTVFAVLTSSIAMWLIGKLYFYLFFSDLFFPGAFFKRGWSGKGFLY